jgi:hypothetical protein
MNELFPRQPVSAATVAGAVIISAVVVRLAVSMVLLLATTILPVPAP